MKKFIYITLAVMLFSGSLQCPDTVFAAGTTAEKVLTTSVNTLQASSLDVVKNPQKYLNKTITMKATFDKFSTLGLDYKPAMRSSENYIGILIKRDDVTDHTIPLSEMKLFLKIKALT